MVTLPIHFELFCECEAKEMNFLHFILLGKEWQSRVCLWLNLLQSKCNYGSFTSTVSTCNCVLQLPVKKRSISQVAHGVVWLQVWMALAKCERPSTQIEWRLQPPDQTPAKTPLDQWPRVNSHHGFSYMKDTGPSKLVPRSNVKMNKKRPSIAPGVLLFLSQSKERVVKIASGKMNPFACSSIFGCLLLGCGWKMLCIKLPSISTSLLF